MVRKLGAHLWGAALCVGTLASMSACSSGTTVSGTYLAKGQGFVELLQLTQSKDGHLIGTLSHAGMKSGGAIERSSDGVTGAVDGRSITLVTNAPLSLGTSMSGTVDGKVITLTHANGSEQFTLVEPAEYQTAVQQLTARGAAIQQRLNVEQAQAAQAKLLADQNNSVADLNRRLTEYAARVTSPNADKQNSAFHATHAKALAQARKYLEKEQTFPRGSYQAGQGAYAIGQVSYQLDSYNYPIEDVPKTGRSHISGYDEEIARSICQHSHDPALTHCAEQDAAIQAYRAARPVVLKRMDDIEATLRDDKAAMKGVVDQAEAYSR